MTLRSRRDLLKLVLIGPALAACGAGRAVSTPTPAGALAPPPRAAPGGLAGVLPSTDLAVGPNNRFLLGLLDERNQPVIDARVQLRFFKMLDEQRAQLRSEAAAPFRSSPQLGERGLYVARAAFDEPGNWGVEVVAGRPNGTSQTLRLSFAVQAESQTPAIGSPAPASKTVTGHGAAALAHICSAQPADDFHRLSIDAALAQRKPLLILFATPGFCPSRMCGPDLEVVQAAVANLGERLNVIHVEIYEGAQPPNPVAAVREWRLPSEPWLFLVGADGRIVDKFEGGVTLDELTPALTALVNA